MPADANYTTLNSNRWSNTEVLTPSCIFAPTTPESLSTAMGILVGGNCQFAVKSGGHMANPGANNIDNGVSIDLANFNTVTIADDRTYVSLGAGSNWTNAYNQTAGHNIGFPGGMCGGTGVGGVSLGGGQSIWSAKLGWVVDSVSLLFEEARTEKLTRRVRFSILNWSSPTVPSPTPTKRTMPTSSRL
jgi:FAD/FMN-containing dehydrogenase